MKRPVHVVACPACRAPFVTRRKLRCPRCAYRLVFYGESYQVTTESVWLRSRDAKTWRKVEQERFTERTGNTYHNHDGKKEAEA